MILDFASTYITLDGDINDKGDNMRTEIIAEIGWNHLGDIHLAKDMISAAAECGVDFVKFQSWSVSNLKQGEWDSDGRRQIYEKAELSYADHEILIDHCKSNNVRFLTSVFSAKDLDKLPPSYGFAIKIPSTEINNEELMKACTARFKTLFVSTGASTLAEIAQMRECISEDCYLTLLHCISMYPCALEKSNMSRMKLLKAMTKHVGYSDHTLGTAAAFYAISTGAEVVEKHFTTDRSLPGRDNKFAATPEEMKIICQFRDDVHMMTKNLNPEYQTDEKIAREQYRQRWCMND